MPPLGPASQAPRPFPTPNTRQVAPKIRLKLSLASRPPLGGGWPEIAPPFSPGPLKSELASDRYTRTLNSAGQRRMC